MYNLGSASLPQVLAQCPSSPPPAPPVANTSMQLVNFPDIVDLTFRILPGTSSRSKWSRLLWR